MKKVLLLKHIQELHWRQLSKTAKNICEKEGSLMNYETSFSQHNYCLNLMVLEKQMEVHPLKSSQVLCSSCQTTCGTICLIQMLNRVLNVTIQKLILYLSVMLREDTNFGKHKLTRYIYMSFSGTHCTIPGTHFTAPATLLETERDQPCLCKYYVKTSPCLCADMILTLHLTNNTQRLNYAKEVQEQTKQPKVSC